MAQVITTPIVCRFAALPGIMCEGELCPYDFPSCRGCPRSNAGKAPDLVDPMKSLIWRGWINGIAGIKK